MSIEHIKEILLKHEGKKNPITSAEIARIIGIVEDDTHAQTRALILKCAEKHGLPLVADNNGYYLITCKEELDDYISNLDSRIAGIEKRKQITTQNYNEWKNNQ